MQRKKTIPSIAVKKRVFYNLLSYMRKLGNNKDNLNKVKILKILIKLKLKFT